MRKPPGVAGRERRLGALAFLSGGCALGYEVLFVRHLTPVLGDALHVHGALLATFLVGVGVGSWLAHRGHRWLAPVEALVGVWALALPWITASLAASPLLAWLTARPVATVAAVAALVAPAALLLGVGLPLFSAYVKAARQREALAFQDVYGAYNAGAVLGVLAVELILVRWVGVRGSLAMLGFTNLAVAAVLWRTAAASVRPPALERHRFGARVVVAVVLASTAAAVTQIFLLRSMDLVLEPHRGNFAMGLAVVLGGIAAGSWLVSRTALGFRDALLLVPLPLLGAYALAVSPVGLLWGGPAGAASPTAALLARLAYAALLGFLPMAFFGATLPALMRTERAVAREAGHLLGLAGLANAAGYLLYVGVLAPRLSGGALLAAVAVASLAAAALAPGPRWSGVRRAGALVSLAVAAVVATVWRDADFHLATRRADVLPADTVEIFRWAGESATLVSSARERWISYNGHPGIRASTAGVVNTAELMSGVVPALAAPGLERAAVLGLGTGITAGAAARIFEAVDVVELNHAFVDMAPRLRYESLDVLATPSARLHLGDGRAFLTGADGLYDAIVNSVPTPTYYSAGKIYTEDFYRGVARALRPGGVFATWLSTSALSGDGLTVVLATLAQTFPHCALYLLRVDYQMAVCGVAPLSFREPGAVVPGGVLRERLGEGLPGLVIEEALVDARLSDDLFAGGVPPAPRPNTDDRPVLEYLVLGNAAGRGTGNPFTGEPERWGIDPLRGASADPPERWARRALLFDRLAPSLFRRAFAPRLAADTARARAWAEVRDAR